MLRPYNGTYANLLFPTGGNCCTSNPTVEDIFWARCGHRLDLQNERVSSAHFDRLWGNSLLLGTPLDQETSVIRNENGTSLDAEIAAGDNANY